MSLLQYVLAVTLLSILVVLAIGFAGAAVNQLLADFVERIAW